MEDLTAKEYLKELLIAHEVEFIEENEWLVPFSKLPAIRATWLPNASQSSGLLQIDVFIEENILIEECFAGLGTDAEGLKDAFNNFSVNSLHVLLSAFWGKHDPQQVDKEIWHINGSDHTVYIGPFGNRGANSEHPGVPDQAFGIIENNIKNSNIKNQYNWFRTFFCNIGDSEKIYEALHNNEKWLNGENALKSLDWPVSNDYYSTRNFIIAIKNT